jgi:YVTN family beta-propeller protein
VEADEVVARLDVGRNPANLTLKPDGGELFVSNQGSDSVSEVATQTNDVGSTYPIGNRPAHGVVSADNAALWISNSGADSLSLYSIEDGRLLSSIHTGDAPDALAFSDDEHLLLAADSKSGDVAVIRTASRLGPALFTMLPAGGSPVAIVVKAMQPKA